MLLVCTPQVSVFVEISLFFQINFNTFIFNFNCTDNDENNNTNYDIDNTVIFFKCGSCFTLYMRVRHGNKLKKYLFLV